MTSPADDPALHGDSAAHSIAAAPSDAVIRDILITNKRGLHARASAKFVQLVERFSAEVTVTRNGETVGGTSIMGLMMLSAGPGTTITVAATGKDADEAVMAIADLIHDKFGEGD
ncbi:MAG: HPr family phosphocarrier protein [Xanthobacteraceae bacterium]